MLPGITVAQFTADIVGLIDGSITSTSGLSSGADKTNSVISGTYPTGVYSKVGASTNTFSKVHSVDNTCTHYFRMTFDSTKMTTFSVAQSYTSGTDTLVNSVGYTVNVTPNPYLANAQNPSGVNIVITSKNIWFSSVTSGISFGLFDLGANGITATYTDNMKMAYINTTTATYGIPYAYTLLGKSSAYSAITGNLTDVTSPTIVSNISGTAMIVENPTFVSNINQGYSAYGVYNLFKLSNTMIALDSVYNTIGVSRIAGVNYAVVTE